jgi:DNA modification methylase
VTAIVTRGNAADLHLPDATVDLIVTSPPYFGLRSYQDGGEHYAGQVGDEATPTEYLDALIACTAEWMRVLKPGGSIFVNLGDKYAADNRGSGGDKKRGEAKWAPAGKAGYAGEGFVRQKSLMLLPQRYALRCIDELGLILRAEIVWAKPNGLPESVTDRVRRSHEQVFHFVKQPRYYSAVDEVREAHANPLDALRPRLGKGQHSGPVSGGVGKDTGGNPLGKLPGSVWEIPTAPLKVPASLGIDHFAAYPPELVRRIVLGWSPAAICTTCDEGVVPVTSKEGARPVARAHRHLPGYADPAGVGMRDMTYRIEGYRCNCPTTWTPQDIASARTTASTIPTTWDRPAAAVDSKSSTPGAIATATTAASATTSTTAASSASPATLRPSVVLDPFGGTGTTALVASAYGRVGISVDLSADYCRLAQWRTTDPGERARVLKVEKPPVQVDGQLGMFEGIA